MTFEKNEQMIIGLRTRRSCPPVRARSEAPGAGATAGAGANTQPQAVEALTYKQPKYVQMRIKTT